eukprot:TRINITY_DN4618_c0_g1_i2.p1 TRINITY_DN4618_c0_g1~~TRINITY_DN4618_c0_g1_i2.p1  ORF type:complete len:131 (-),score=30.49 TRINITY_DN4618_c0_g1_i2:56-448(-)
MGSWRKNSVGLTYSREIRKFLLYIIVYALWVHPYVGFSIHLMLATPDTINYGFWLYFLIMVNSLGTFNFIAYGYSEGLFMTWYAKMTGRDVESKGRSMTMQSSASDSASHSSTSSSSSSPPSSVTTRTNV